MWSPDFFSDPLWGGISLKVPHNDGGVCRHVLLGYGPEGLLRFQYEPEAPGFGGRLASLTGWMNSINVTDLWKADPNQDGLTEQYGFVKSSEIEIAIHTFDAAEPTSFSEQTTPVGWFDAAGGVPVSAQGGFDTPLVAVSGGSPGALLFGNMDDSIATKVDATGTVISNTTTVLVGSARNPRG